MSIESRIHRLDLSLSTDPGEVEQFLNSLEGERLTFIPNVTVAPFLLTSRVDFLLIVDGAGSDEGISLPEGCCRISGTVNLPPGARLVGAGMDKTILYRESGRLYSQPMLRVNGGGNASGGTQISGLAVVGVRETNDPGQDYEIFFSNVTDFRVDHCYFEDFGFAAMRVEGASYGVVDHSTFAEDSLFVDNRHAIAANAGAYYVFRHNRVLRNVVACAGDGPRMGYGSARGTRYVEINRNAIEDPVSDWYNIGIRGGSGVIFGNMIRGFENPILLILEWGTPDSAKAGYPVYDQIRDLYIWVNQMRVGHSKPRVDETGIDFIEAGRDYFTEPASGYSSYEYPHPLTNGGAFVGAPRPPGEK